MPEQPYIEIVTDKDKATLRGMLEVLVTHEHTAFTPPECTRARDRLKAYLEHLLKGGRVGVWDYSRETGGWRAGDALTPEQNEHGLMIGNASQLIIKCLSGEWTGLDALDMEGYVCYRARPLLH